MLKTNEKKIVEMLHQCKPIQPKRGITASVAGHSGVANNVSGIGGITLNIEIGDSVVGFVGDHLEPGVSCSANSEKSNEFPNNSLQYYSCCGNEAVIISGKAKGKKGVVIGHL